MKILNLKKRREKFEFESRSRHEKYLGARQFQVLVPFLVLESGSLGLFERFGVVVVGLENKKLRKQEDDRIP